MACKHSPVGKTFKAKRWAKRFSKGRPIRKVKMGWKIYANKRRSN